MPLTARQLDCLFKSKHISYATEIVWLKRKEQNILLVGEYHVAPTCENGDQDDYQETETCDPNMTHMVKTIIRWVKLKKCKLLLEIHPFLAGKAHAEDVKEETQSIAALHQKLGYENFTGFDTRKDFFPPFQLVDELVNIHNFYETHGKKDDAELYRQILLEWTILPFLIRNSALDLYVTYVRNKSNKMTSGDKKVWNKQVDEFIKRRHMFAIEKSDDATMTEIFEEHQRSGQEMVDFISISSILESQKDDFVVFGGVRHVAHQMQLLQEFGFVLKKIRQGSQEDVNCI